MTNYSCARLLQEAHKTHRNVDLRHWVETVEFINNCCKLANSPDIIPVDMITYHSSEVQKVLREVWNQIMDVNAGMGFVILQDNTICCIDSSWYIAQFDGCDYREVCIPCWN